MSTRRRISASERLEIFLAGEGRCHICGERVDAGKEPWDVEHVVALELGGDEARGSDNLRPAHRKCHRSKSRDDAGRIAKAKRQEQRTMGIKRQPKGRPIPGSKASGWKQRLTSQGPKPERRT